MGEVVGGGGAGQASGWWTMTERWIPEMVPMSEVFGSAEMSMPMRKVVDVDWKLRVMLAPLAGVRPDDLEVTERWFDHRQQAEAFRLPDGRVLFVAGSVMRNLFPPKDPFVEAFETVALALHEAEKKRERVARERARLEVLFGPDLAELKLLAYDDPGVAVQIGDEVIVVRCYYDAARNMDYAEAIAAVHNTGMFRTQDSMMEAMPALREAFGTPPQDGGA